MPFMLLDLHARIKDVLRSTIRSQWNIEPPEITLSQTPKIELGELAHIADYWSLFAPRW